MLELLATALAKRGGDDDDFFNIWKRDGGDDGFFNIWKRDDGDDGFFNVWKRDGGDDDFFGIWKRQEDDLGAFTKTAGSLIYLAVFIMLCFVGYVLFSVYPALAIVEDEKPPVYESIPSNIDETANPNGPKTTNKNAPPPPPYSTSAGGSSSTSPDEAPVPVTSSLRRIYKLLKANGGNLRGLACAIARGVLSAPLVMIFALALGPHAVPFASLLASLVLVQYNVAWVHIVISRASPLRFWHRLPTFTSAFNSTWRVVVLRWAAMQVANAFPWIAMYLFGMAKLEKIMNTADLGRVLVVVLISFFSQLLIVLPAEIVFVRVLASTLPEDTEAVVSFDRTFEGKVEPAVIGGSGHVSIRDAWATFSKSAWRRLVKLYVKAIGVMMTAWLVLLPVGLLSMYVLAGERK